MTDDLFAEGDVRVSKTMAYLAGVSYPINGITAVLVTQKDLNLKMILGAVVLGIIGLVAAQSNVMLTLICLVIAAILIFVAFQRPYRLVLRTAAGDTQALENKNGQFINQDRAAIETAVAHRG
jgi:cell division protein FtsW (lipid II flippase)